MRSSSPKSELPLYLLWGFVAAVSLAVVTTRLGGMTISLGASSRAPGVEPHRQDAAGDTDDVRHSANDGLRHTGHPQAGAR